MKMSVAERPVERFSVNEENKFTIRATGKAFRILSSGLYKEKILAIVRELSCNAYDAHVDAGKGDQPFLVHLPNSFEPFFAIRDHGKGLSDHMMRTVFTTYFESTKTDDNNQIGGLGLGCKSPLAYVDSFAVTSYHEGYRRSYTVFFDETDTPSITLMAEEASNEPSGIEVKLSVQNYSFNEFREKAEQVYQYFPVKPLISGNPQYKHIELEPILSGDGFKIFSNNGHGKAVMGTVGYPIDYYSVPELSDTKAAHNLLTMHCQIEFPIGNLDITAGREELSYDKRTKANIANRIKEVLAEIPVRALEKIQECETELEARKFYSRVMVGAIREMFPNGGIPFKGKIISNNVFQLPFKKEFSDLIFSEYTILNGRLKTTTHTSGTYSDDQKFDIQTSKKNIIIIDDVGNRTEKSRVRKFINDNPNITYNNHVMCVRVAFGHDKNNECLVKFMKLLEGSEFKLMSELPKSDPAPRSSVNVKVIDNWWASYYGNKKHWSDARSIPETGGLYVKMKGSMPLDDSGEPFKGFRELLENAKSAGLITSSPIYGFPVTVYKKFFKQVATDDNPEEEWIEFFGYLREKIAEKPEWLESVSKKLQAEKFTAIGYYERPFLAKIAEKLDADHQIATFNKKWDEFNSLKSNFNVEKATKVLSIMNVDIPECECNLHESWKSICENYEMLQYVFKVSRWERDNEKIIDDVIRYISLSDRK